MVVTEAQLLLCLLFFGLLIISIAVLIILIINLSKENASITEKKIGNTKNSFKDDTVSKAINTYKEKKFMNDLEYSFYKKIKPIEKKINVHIVPKVCLGAIVEKCSNVTYQSELYMIVDFAVFNSDYSKVLLLISLSDKAQGKKKRVHKLANICEQTGIKLVKFDPSLDNRKDYILNKIVHEIEEND